MEHNRRAWSAFFVAGAAGCSVSALWLLTIRLAGYGWGVITAVVCGALVLALCWILARSWSAWCVVGAVTGIWGTWTACAAMFDETGQFVVGSVILLVVLSVLGALVAGAARLAGPR